MSIFDITTPAGRAAQAAADDIVVSAGASLEQAEDIISRVVAQFRLSDVPA